MWSVFQKIATNLGVTFETYIVLIFMVLGLVFYAKDFKIGLLMHMVVSGCLFMWFYAANLNYKVPIIIFFMTLVILAFTLFAVEKKAELGGIT